MEPGKSIAKKELETSDDIIKWYDEIFNYFKLDKIDLVGSSRGGWLAVNYALHSDRVEKIVLLSPAQTFTFIKAEKKLFTSIGFVAAPKKRKLIKAMESFSSNVYNIKPEFREQFYLATEGTKKNTSIFQMTPFAEKDLKSLSIPVLLLIGDNDIINSQSSIEKAQKYIPNLKAETIANAGHFLSFDQPDIINKKTLDFLSN
jgi:pimeloyl-ACP methyl ester carboxylesterase